jgi:autotransporter passenger strand-loop-strand repeat protein
MANGVIISSGVYVVSGGQVETNAIVLNGGIELVSAQIAGVPGEGATDLGAQISGGGEQIVDFGAFASGVTVFAGGSQVVEDGGTAIGTVVSSGGTLLLRGDFGGAFASG